MLTNLISYVVIQSLFDEKNETTITIPVDGNSQSIINHTYSIKILIIVYK
jgi:hypothetical protein